jgi:multiple sugar transport system ATP-binding protein
MGKILLDRITKKYDNGVHAVQDLSLEIADGEFMIVVGPSGCGKTTALRMIAGLESITSGDLYIGGDRVNGLSERERDIAMVFQNYALYPHMTVADNIGFSLRMSKVPKIEIRERVRRTAEMLALSDLLKRKPRELSGGQRQRVAMGRAIIREPQAFLMDEPLSNLDAQLRVQMRGEIEALQRRLRVTTVYVTHDQVEAMTMGDRIAVMRDGALQQVGSPEEVYAAPANLFVARFIGSPPMNLAAVELEPTGDGGGIRLGPEMIPIGRELLDRLGLRPWLGRSVVVGVRPTDLRDHSLGQRGSVITVAVDRIESLGSEALAFFLVGARPVTAAGLAAASGGELPSSPALGDEGALFCASVDPALKVRRGDRIELTVRPEDLHFFDPGTENAIGRSVDD